MTAIDMTPFISAKSEQLNADDLMGGPRTITVTHVTASPEGAEQPVSVYFEGDEGKPFRPCKTARRIMVAVWGADASKYAGRSMTIYRDPEVTFGGLKVGGIRISHMSHLEREMMVAVMKSKGKKAPMVIKPLAMAEQPKPATQRQTAEQWAQEHIAATQNAADVAALDAVIQRGSKAIAKLATDKPELAEQVTQAYTARRGQLVQEGPADDQRGEAFADTAGWAE